VNYLTKKLKIRWIKLSRKSLLWLVLLGAGALAVYIQNSFPMLSGEQKLPGLQKTVRITRDAADVTHIFADNQMVAAFAMGYTHAQERSWQLEFNRRIMHGQLSEILGPNTLETDKLMHTLGILRAAQRQFDTLPKAAQDVLQAYAAGINGFHAHAGQALPPEFHLLRTQPGQWTAQDSLGWGIMMALDLGGNWALEFARLSAAQKLPTQRLWDLFPAYPGESPETSVDLSQLYGQLGVFNMQPPNTTKSIAINDQATRTNGLFGSVNAQYNASDVLGGEIGHIEGKGSNNWVVAGSHSTSGKPLLANDPHLGLSAPAIWYFARLHVAGADKNPPEMDGAGCGQHHCAGRLQGTNSPVGGRAVGGVCRLPLAHAKPGGCRCERRNSLQSHWPGASAQSR
jgi:penicillin G amidase